MNIVGIEQLQNNKSYPEIKVMIRFTTAKSNRSTLCLILNNVNFMETSVKEKIDLFVLRFKYKGIPIKKANYTKLFFLTYCVKS